jgi:excisionase family DNA binding protein
MNVIKTTSNPLLLGVKQAGEMLGLSPWTIRQWCYTGKIASHKIGTRLMVSQEAIDQLLAESLRPRLQGVR